MHDQDSLQIKSKRPISFIGNRWFLIFISFVIGCFVSYGIPQFFSGVWNQYHLEKMLPDFFKLVFFYLNTSKLVKLGAFALLTALFTALNLKFFLPRFFNSIQHRNRWLLLISFVIIFLFSCWLLIRMDGLTAPWQNGMGISPHANGVNLLENVIDLPVDSKLSIFMFGCIQLMSIFLISVLLFEIIILIFQYRAVAFTIFYFITIAFLQIVNIPENYYYYTGWLIPVYSLARFIYMAYLFAIFYSCGKLLFKLFKISTLNSDTMDRTILYLITGSSLLNIFMVFLGMIHGIYTLVGWVLTLPLVYLAYEDVVAFYSGVKRQLLSGLQAFREWLSTSPHSISPERLITMLVIITAVLEAFYLLIVHGLSPDLDLHTGNDVARHYIPYYQAVIRNHGISVNSVWYQIYYSRYNGLYFLSVMLSDKYGAELVSFLYAIICALILYSLISKISKSRFIKWFALCQFFSVIWSSDVSFSKLHIIEMAGLAFCLWAAVKLFHIEQRESRIFSFICSIGLIGILLFSYKIMLFALPFSFAIAIAFVIFQKKEAAKNMLMIFVALTISLLVVLGYNYLTTGMFDDHPFTLMWKLADQNKFSQWVSPYTMLQMIEGNRFSESISSPSLFQLFNFYTYVFHIDKLLFIPNSLKWGTYHWLILFFLHWLIFFFSIVLLAVSVFMAGRSIKKTACETKFIFFSSTLIIVIAILISLIFGKWSSLERTFLMTVFFMLMIFISLWEMGISQFIRQEKYRHVKTVIYFTGLVLLLFNTRNGLLSAGAQNGQIAISLPNSVAAKQVDYLMGRESYAEFTKTDEVDLHDYYEAHQFIGEDERILSLNLSFALPGRSIEREGDFAYREWHIMAFEDAEKAKDAFQREGLNYFLISIDPQKQIVLWAFPFSPLFHPAHIADNFDVIWKSDQTYLLTWKGDGINPYPWDEQFLQAYQEKVEEQGLKLLYDRIHDYYLENGENYPVYPDNSLEPVS